MKTTGRPKIARFRPLPDELFWRNDTPQRRAARARAEKILYDLIDEIKQDNAFEQPVVLSLLDFDDNDVSIAYEQRRLIDSEHTKWVYVIETSTTWIDGATDGELRAVFAHEIGHAVLGHCPKDDTTPKQLWEKKVKNTHGKNTKLVSAVAMPGVILLAPGPVVLPLLVALACLMGGWLIYRLVANCVELRVDRQEEFEADAFCLRYAQGEDLVSDLIRSYPNPMDALAEKILWRFNTHPSLDARAKAMGLDVTTRQIYGWVKTYKRSAGVGRSLGVQ